MSLGLAVARATAGETPTWTGASAPFEVPVRRDLGLSTISFSLAGEIDAFPQLSREIVVIPIYVGQPEQDHVL